MTTKRDMLLTLVFLRFICSRFNEQREKIRASVLVLPCGRSAHTEAGWFAGQGKKVFAYIPNKDCFEPELMYKLFTKVCISLEELIMELK